jgi:glycosyltransferase involved in cell wall biosynthesis
MERSCNPISVLHLANVIRETNAAYNEHCLPFLGKYDITICTFFEAGITPPKEISLFDGRTPPQDFFHSLINGSFSVFFRSLKAAFEKKEYDIIHSHAPHVGLLFLLFLVPTRLYAKIISRSVFTVHSSYRITRPRNRLMLIPMFAFFRRVVCCSKASYESFPGFYRWLAGSRLCFVQNGVDLDRVDRTVGNRQGGRCQDYFTISTVGRLVAGKNLISALSAFQHDADPCSRMLIIGDGPMRDALMTRIRANGLTEQVVLTGLIPRDEVYEYLLKTDLFISTSYGEGLPVAVLEAMACGCPVLLSDIPPHREIAEGTDFIPLVHADDVPGFAREIKRFRQMSASDRTDIGERCRKLIEERFSLTAMHKGYEEVYAQVLSQH